MASTTSSTNANAADVIDIATNVATVRNAMARAAQNRDIDDIRLVAVSKTKPLALLQRAYDEADVRCFGENYVQELVEKVPQMPTDVTWHFIGNLQSNKVNQLLKPFLATSSSLHRLVLETVGSVKLARKLHTAIPTVTTQGDHEDEEDATFAQQLQQRLSIFVQVNTSGEDSKSGCAPSEVVELCQFITNECSDTLRLQGLMTIGAPGDASCLDRLVECRRQVQEALSSSSTLQRSSPLELSMGMSGDYELAIAKGSTNVRVGSTIFGPRDYSNVNK